MPILAQHGYGKSDKIERALMLGLIDGVILSPKDELQEKLQAYVSSLSEKFPGIRIVLDPQFHASTVRPPSLGNLTDYPFFRQGLTRKDFTAPSNIRAYVKDTIDFQVAMPLTEIVSPTVCFDDFRDPWSQIALSMAQESVQSASSTGGRPIYVSLFFNESALKSHDGLSEFLDILTLLEVDGFYLNISRSAAQQLGEIDPTVLENFMYLVYVLATVNEYDVVVGHSDFIGLPLTAVGAKYFATGWHSGQKSFSLAGRFAESSGGGRQPRPRYTSLGLLNSVLVIPELKAMLDSKEGSRISALTMSSDRELIRDPSGTPWPKDACILQHWEVLSKINDDLKKAGDVRKRLDSLSLLISKAEENYIAFQKLGIPFERKSGNAHLENWKVGISGFRKVAGI